MPPTKHKPRTNDSKVSRAHVREAKQPQRPKNRVASDAWRQKSQRTKMHMLKCLWGQTRMRACLPATQKSRTYLQHTPTIVRVHEKFWNGTGAINHDLSEGEVRETKKERVKEKFVHV